MFSLTKRSSCACIVAALLVRIILFSERGMFAGLSSCYYLCLRICLLVSNVSFVTVHPSYRGMRLPAIFCGHPAVQ